ncbi:EAL domain-containing protein [Klebsiella indica]|uniref:cyclic-guanylate-specific phosphodiesterase n=1 Tax=Klebsiella indica TaxID=2582917 RepID=A0A5R9LLV7_9ENTR|nr:EAL domain-containing protein [Klebsiella indica]TLV21586.1 EAL domain-containing protein [Klebsiella indica]
MKFINKKKWLLVGGGVTVFLSVFLTNSIMLNHQRGRLSDQGHDLLSRAENVTTQIVSAINHVQSSRIDSCDKQAIAALREVIWRYVKVNDLGIVEHGKLACTANWGMLDKPLPLPDNKYVVSNGYSIYKGIKNYLPYGVVMDMSQYNNIISFTSPFAFRPFLRRNMDLDFSLVSLNGRHVFLAENKIKGNSASLVKIRLCSSQYDFCANVAEKKQGFFSLSLALMALIMIAAFIIGMAFVYSVLSYLSERRSLEAHLKKAIANKKIYMEYQPLVCAKNESIVGVEALVRWHDKIFGQVSPELFISMAEQMNVYNEISKLVIETSIKELKTILQANKNFTLAINIGKYEITDPHFLDNLLLLLQNNNVRPQQIKIEITERSNEYYKNITAFSLAAMKRGLRIALDDFGTGSSNLLWLTEVFYDEIKLDKFFVSGLKNEYKRNILMSVLNVVYKLNKKIVFEGVESKMDFEFVKSFDENALIQGWYFYKAMPIKKLTGLVLPDNSPIRE